MPHTSVRVWIVCLALVAGATLAGPGSTPYAQERGSADRDRQASALNMKQRLLAGEPMPLNMATEIQLVRERRASSPRRVYAPGRVIVKLADGGTEQSIRTLSAHARGRSVTRSAYADFVVVHLDPAVDVVEAATELAAAPGVVYAEPDAMRYASYVPNDPLYSLQWNMHRLGMERAWDINRGADSAVVVAVIDGGVAYLDKGNVKEAPDLVGTNFVAPHDFIWEDDEPVDFGGHGTHVTGTIAQRTGNGLGVAGVAFNVSIMPVKAISDEIDEALGAPNLGTSTTVADAIHWAVDHGANVINMSFGGPGQSTAEHDALAYALSKGVFLAAAAGNSGDTDNEPSFPAASATEFEGLVAVGALDYNFNRAPYSNSNDYVEISAPGGNLDVDVDGDGYPDGILQETLDLDLVSHGIFNQFGYFFLQGTSMASPHVSGLAALLVKQGVKDPKAIEAILERTATDVGATGRDNDTGFGVINPRAAIFGMGLSR